MFDDRRSFITRAFLRSALDIEFQAYCEGESDILLLARLSDWDKRLKLSEKQAETAFVQTFFVDIWGYGETGRVDINEHTLIPKLRIGGEGAGGGSGEVDLAAGWFKGRLDATPQLLCEFKDIRSALDAKQNRKGDNRTPVEQCLGYVRGARRSLFGNEPVQPWWGLVTDMNEFRLFWWDRAPQQYARFYIRTADDLFRDYDLLSSSDDAKFDRFLFQKLFSRDFLIAEAGRPPLLRLVEKQWVREEALEDEFYERYKAVRERLFSVIRVNNPEFPGTPTELLRLTQKLLDRFIFAFYCEDMGERMLFPPQFVREHLRVRCNEPYYDDKAEDFWPFFKRLFAQMNTGGLLGKQSVPFINGGLFAPDPLIDALSIPNHVFAAHEQGLNPASLEIDRNTIFYLSARYNYASRGDIRESVSLYTLGRIFEQSITELEYRAGELENRETIAKLSKRKRDGVYYTPEPVVNYLVEETLSPWFADARRACGVDAASESLAAIDSYEQILKGIRIVDPACGSGAFLISAFRRLLDERMEVAREREAISGGQGAVAEQAIIADILTNNIYGVDINPAAVEIGKLALWLHSARANSPLSSLDHTIRCGNSLVGPDFWAGRTGDDDGRERINAFDWRAAFPEVFARGGFDVVLGNPPYVKLQNLRKVHPDVADYLQANRGDDTYVSAQTGNFDLYLPFIEKGLRLLREGGRMAYIAPSLWAVNEYGAGLRRLIAERRQLDRWIDFKAHQVFKEAITYTALQFFTRARNDVARIAVAPYGKDSDIDWTDEELAVDYAALEGEAEWLIATGEERALIERLARDCKRLDDETITQSIYQGLITSADHIYHLRRLAPERFACSPKGADSYEVLIEDAIMKPLVSGPEAKRYEAPETETYLLFPYARDDKGAMRLIPAAAMARDFPLAWKYLKSWEKELRGRESGKMDRDQDWWGYVYPKNLDKQDCEKLVVAQTVPSLRLCADDRADKYINNVRVNGILAAAKVDMFFLLGVMNGPVADFVFRRVGKPKQGGWYEANRQFIAPLPVPDATIAEAAEVARRAKALQKRWTKRRKLLAAASDRLSILPRAKWKARQLWTDLPDIAALAAEAPKAFKLKPDKRKWADARLDELEAGKLAAMQALLDARLRLSVEAQDGELALLADGAPSLRRIYADAGHVELVFAYWRFLLMAQGWTDAARLSAEMRRPPSDVASPATRQFIEKVNELASENAAIATEEAEMNALLYRLYRLTDDERALVENDRKALLL
jgi:hypothetical protein